MKTQRIRDPIHGLIVFDKDEPVDALAWNLINTPEFQRLRRIKQLGVSEFVYPSATHTRFAHSIGVFHTARKLIDIIDRELEKMNRSPDTEREFVVQIAALLHDIGHGPFSHTFESVQKERDIKKKHEKWSAEIIRNPCGKVMNLLNSHTGITDLAEKVAKLLESEDPVDIYHSVVSSSFDADRLDYLRRDKFMTGTGAGAIDFEWLMEHVRVAEIPVEAAESGEDSEMVETLCLDIKALPAAEQFLLSRYTLHEQVYFHKTTRCIEKMIAILLADVAKKAEDGLDFSTIGINNNHPLILFYRHRDPDVNLYLDLDDQRVSEFIDLCSKCSDPFMSELGTRIRYRDLYKVLDMKYFGSEVGISTYKKRLIDEQMETEIKERKTIFDGSASLSAYTVIGGDEDKQHKKLHIIDGEKPKEITTVSKLIETLSQKKSFDRYYFVNDKLREQAKNIKKIKGKA